MTDESCAPSMPMLRALDLARSVLGQTSPNPAVGAVLVRNGEIVGEGVTHPPGGPHAEVVAIGAAGEQAQGATLYVTLEPCSVQGRTPPCVDAVVAAGISEVVVAVGDPDPRVDGRGLTALRAAGLDVRVGDGSAAARRHYEAYRHHRGTGRPFVTVKFAASLDGKIAAVGGDSRWVSGPETRVWAHRLRPMSDAILIGVNTVLVDNPELTARPNGLVATGHQPLRIVLDSRGRTPPAARVLQDQAMAKTLIVTTEAASAEWRAGIEARGAAVLVVPAEEGHAALEPLLNILGTEYGIVSLLVEGGGRVHGAFFDRRLVNKVQAVIAPLIVGGEAPTAVHGQGVSRMIDALRLSDVQIDRLGDDLLITGYPRAPRPVDEVTLRPAGADDVHAYLALIGDPAERTTLEPRVRAGFSRVSDNAGSIWVAQHQGACVGGIAVAYPASAGSARSASTAVAALDLLVVRDDWQVGGLEQRLVEAAEASAGGRGFRWVTAPVDRGSAGRRDWTRRGYRYFRQGENGTVYLIKELTPPP